MFLTLLNRYLGFMDVLYIFLRDEISKLKIADGSSLADLVALNIGQIGENMALGDATFIQAASGTI